MELPAVTQLLSCVSPDSLTGVPRAGAQMLEIFVCTQYPEQELLVMETKIYFGFHISLRFIKVVVGFGKVS